VSGVVTVRDLGSRYGNLGSVLARKDGRYYVVSSTSTPIGPQTLAFRATRRGRITSWREVAGDYGMTIEQVIADLEGRCHCGADLRGSDHCPACFCGQLEQYCDQET
jgi:hypothetical protein